MGGWIRDRLPWIVLILIILFSAILPFTWFEPGHMLLKADPIFPLDPKHYFMGHFSLWVNKMNLGEAGVSTASLLHRFIQAIPSFFGASDILAEKIHFMLWFSLPGITIALFVRELVKRLSISSWAIPIASSFYLFNLYRVANIVDNNHLVVYAILPLSLLLLIRAFYEKDNWLPPVIGLAFSTLFVSLAATNPPMYAVYWIGLLIPGLAMTIAYRDQWRRSLKIWATFFGCFFLLNIYWIVPFIQMTLRQTSLAGAGNKDWLNELSAITSFGNVIRLVGSWDWFGDWQGEAYAPYAQMYRMPIWRFLLIIPFLLTFIVLFFKQTRHYLVGSIAVIGAIGLLFSQGNHPPFGLVFTWAVKHLPFFWIFRSPWYKFTNLTALAFAILIGLGLAMVYELLLKQRRDKIAAAMLCFALLLPLFLAQPLITGSRWLRKADVKNLAPDSVPYPVHIRQAADWLNAQPGSGAVALLPYMPAESYTWGYSGMADPFYYMSKRPIFIRGDRIGYLPNHTPGASLGYRIFVEQLYSKDSKAEAMAKLLGIKYVILRNDSRYDFYKATDSPEFIKDRLSVIPSARLAARFGQEGQSWDIYELTSVKPATVYATGWVDRVESHPIDSFASVLASGSGIKQSLYPALFFTVPPRLKDDELTIKMEQLFAHDPAPPDIKIQEQGQNYTVTGKSTDPFVLVLNKNYDPLWQARATGAQISRSVIANSYAPAWLVEPNGQFSIRVYFAPQRALPWLIGVSIVTALALISLLRYRDNRNKKSVT